MTMRSTLLIVTLLLAACGGSKPAAQLYGLRASDLQVAPCARPSSIKIVEPVAGPGLDNPRIAVIQPGNKQTFYSNVRWSAPTTRMLQHYLADSFERSGLFSTVTTDDATTKVQWLLESQLRNFAVDQSGGGRQAAIRLTATLVDASTHEPVLSVPLHTTRDVSGLNMQAIAGVFNEEINALTQQLLTTLRPKTCR